MAYDAINNFALSTVATAPSPAASGTSLVVAAGEGSKFPTAPFNAVVWPANSQPTTANAEIVRVTNISTDTFTITRQAEGTSARTIIIGDQIMLPVTKRTLEAIQNYASQDGWIAAQNQAGTAETWTYAAADDPTFTFTISGDFTTKYYAGMRIKLTQSTGGTKYFIVTKVAYSDPNTTVTVYGGTDYNLENEAITSPYWSMMKAPAAFPLDPTKWTVITTDTNSNSQASPTATTWYNPGTTSITVPIGVWRINYQANIATDQAGGTSSDSDVSITLSTANNSESDTDLTAQERFYNDTNQKVLNTTIIREKTLVLTSKTQYYLNVKTTIASANSIKVNGNVSKTIIRAISAYL